MALNFFCESFTNFLNLNILHLFFIGYPVRISIENRHLSGSLKETIMSELISLVLKILPKGKKYSQFDVFISRGSCVVHSSQTGRFTINFTVSSHHNLWFVGISNRNGHSIKTLKSQKFWERTIKPLWFMMHMREIHLWLENLKFQFGKVNLMFSNPSAWGKTWNGTLFSGIWASL